MALQTVALTAQGRSGRHRVVPLLAGVTLGVVAAVLVLGGGWALWQDRIDRDASGFVPIGTTNLRTDTYALVGKLRGDGPGWLWGSTALGTARVRATSQAAQPLFVGIARTDQIAGYFNAAGYATIDHLASNAVTPHPGRAPAIPPARAGIWSASTQGTGQQTLRWKPRAGDWSIVLMNVDATAGVAVRGDVGARVPLLPWLALALLVTAAALTLLGGWLIVGAIRGLRPPKLPASDVSGVGQARTTFTERIDVKGVHLAEKVKDLVHEGNVRRVVIKDPSGKAVLEMPMTVGVVGALAAPKMAALGALAAMATDYSIDVEREHGETTEPIVTPA